MQHQNTNRASASNALVHQSRRARDSTASKSSTNSSIFDTGNPDPPSSPISITSDLDESTLRWIDIRAMDQKFKSSPFPPHDRSSRAQTIPSTPIRSSTKREDGKSEYGMLRPRNIGVEKKGECKNGRCTCSCHVRNHRRRRTGGYRVRDHHVDSVLPTPPPSPDIGPLLRRLGHLAEVSSGSEQRNCTGRGVGGRVRRSRNGRRSTVMDSSAEAGF
ncbi:hypothetical protein VTL71DRAFT_10602 [Oculimacula yallundae]|uniref:Uncharacterized protein n=1 Tax=Oculimacula yallundae TaxID=86028 RepID=A0ABR4CTG8_9HELO